MERLTVAETHGVRGSGWVAEFGKVECEQISRYLKRELRLRKIGLLFFLSL